MATVEYKGRKVCVEVGGVDTKDYPDFCDAYLEEGYFIDTDEDLTDAELDELQEQLDMSQLAVETLY